MSHGKGEGRSPMIHFDTDRYFAALWFIGFEGNNDCLAALWRFQDQPDTWQLIWRFRYGGEGDEEHRSWYEANHQGMPEAALVEQTTRFFNIIKDLAPTACQAFYEIPVGADGNKAAKILSTFNFAHIHPASGEELKKIKKSREEEARKRSGGGSKSQFRKE